MSYRRMKSPRQLIEVALPLGAISEITVRAKRAGSITLTRNEMGR